MLTGEYTFTRALDCLKPRGFLFAIVLCQNVKDRRFATQCGVTTLY